jgi:hypothetical protein
MTKSSLTKVQNEKGANMTQVNPIIGSRVWYYPSRPERDLLRPPFFVKGDGPLDAGVAHVFSDSEVNLSVIDSLGHHHARQRVTFIADSDAPLPTDGSAYATWPDIHPDLPPISQQQISEAPGNHQAHS